MKVRGETRAEKRAGTNARRGLMIQAVYAVKKWNPHALEDPFTQLLGVSAGLEKNSSE